MEKTIAKISEDKPVSSVYKTYNYSKFKDLKGNRMLNQVHLKRLINSMKEKFLISPIIVNEHFKVIDGQHRLEASESLGKPIYYIICPTYKIEEVQILNTFQHNWKRNDYLESHCANGNPAYLKFKKFMEDFPEFGIQSSERILTIKKSASNNSYKKVKSKNVDQEDDRTYTKYFEAGLLELPNLDESYKIANELLQFKPYYNGFHKPTFVSAFLTIREKDIYNHEEMINKVRMQPSQLTDCVNVNQYKELLEEIYNWKRRDKVSLKY